MQILHLHFKIARSLTRVLSTLAQSEPVAKVHEAPTIRRWGVLLAFWLAASSNAILGIGFAPIAAEIQRYYSEEQWKVDVCLTSSYMVGYIVMIGPCSLFLDAYGLFAGVLLGTLATTLGAWVRFLGSGRSGFWWVVLGQAMAASGQPLLFNTPAALAAQWFPPSERSFATTIASMANAVGSGIGLSYTPILAGMETSGNATEGSSDGFGQGQAGWRGAEVDVGQEKLADMHGVLLWQAIVASGATVLVIVLFGGGEKRAEQPDGGAGRLWRTVWQCLRDRDFLILVAAFGLGLGVFNGLSTLLEELMHPAGYMSGDAGALGAALLGGGVLSSGLIGAALDHTRRYKEFFRGGIALSVLTVGALCMVILRSGSSEVLIVVAGIFAGGCLLPLLPISLELGAECTYPAPEEVSSSMLILAGQVLGVMTVAAMDALRGEPVCPPTYVLEHDTTSPCRFPGCLVCEPPQANATLPSSGLPKLHPLEPTCEVTTSVAFMISLLFASCVLAWMYNGKYKRMEAEARALDAVGSEEETAQLIAAET